MRRPLTITLTVLGTLIVVPTLTLATTAVINAVVTASELSSIAPYGQLVVVEGKQMNVVVSGDSGGGEETIVLLPGLGTAAPALDFAPLIDALDDEHRVVAVEPFGTGLSDQTDAPRTAENITREVHEALGQLGIDRYVLMGHSIAGIYALTYSAAYADEMVAFVGIDSSVPGQPGAEEPIVTGGMSLLRDLGISRALAALAGDPYEGLPHDPSTKEQMAALSTKNSTAPTMLDEFEHAARTFAEARGAVFPRDLPVLLFVVSEDPELPGWASLHEKQAAGVEYGRVVLLDGGHYLHHTRSPEIADETAAFLASESSR